MSQQKTADTKKSATAAEARSKMWRAYARRALLMALAVGGICAGLYLAWQSVAHDVLRHDSYRLSLDRFTVTPQPAWIRKDVRSEVFREGGFENDMWLHDPNLAEQISKTFALHPWVAKVERVSIRGGVVQVDLAYRRPVCMVEVPGGVFPVDVEGVLLPRDDFSPAEARTYPRLAGVTTVPAGLVGMPWGDLHVVGGAEIAAALVDSWEELRLDHIDVVATGTPEILFELIPRTASSRAKDKIVWGHAPGQRETNEPATEQKVALLKEFLGKPTLSGPSVRARELDLRHGGGAGRTAMSDQTGAEDDSATTVR
ncbi:MAG TPA: hypothetical protein VGN12_23750 [Pirellulales bacterium]|jgi:hypothetical protein